MMGIKPVKKTKRPIVLTVEGKAEVVECIRRGLIQAKKGLGRSVDEVFDSFERDCGDFLRRRRRYNGEEC